MTPEAMPCITGEYVPVVCVNPAHGGELSPWRLVGWLDSAGGFLAFPLLEICERGGRRCSQRGEKVSNHTGSCLLGEEPGFILNAVGRPMENFNQGRDMC